MSNFSRSQQVQAGAVQPEGPGFGDPFPSVSASPNHVYDSSRAVPPLPRMGVSVSDPVTATTAAQNSTGLGVTSGALTSRTRKDPPPVPSGADLEAQEGIRNCWVMCTGTPIGGWAALSPVLLEPLACCVCPRLASESQHSSCLILPSGRMKATMPGFRLSF